MFETFWIILSSTSKYLGHYLRFIVNYLSIYVNCWLSLIKIRCSIWLGVIKIILLSVCFCLMCYCLLGRIIYFAKFSVNTSACIQFFLHFVKDSCFPAVCVPSYNIIIEIYDFPESYCVQNIRLNVHGNSLKYVVLNLKFCLYCFILSFSTVQCLNIKTSYSEINNLLDINASAIYDIFLNYTMHWSPYIVLIFCNWKTFSLFLLDYCYSYWYSVSIWTCLFRLLYTNYIFNSGPYYQALKPPAIIRNYFPLLANIRVNVISSILSFTIFMVLSIKFNLLQLSCKILRV